VDTRTGTQRAESLDPASARELLRRLRDLNLTHRNLRADGGALVSIEGCVSLDEPVEEDLRYLLSVDGLGEHTLRIGWSNGALRIELSRDGAGEPVTLREVRLLRACDGRATAPDLLARVDPSSADPRAVEHFLRRVVRGALAA
jgi:hypothetical protein